MVKMPPVANRSTKKCRAGKKTLSAPNRWTPCQPMRRLTSNGLRNWSASRSIWFQPGLTVRKRWFCAIHSKADVLPAVSALNELNGQQKSRLKSRLFYVHEFQTLGSLLAICWVGCVSQLRILWASAIREPLPFESRKTMTIGRPSMMAFMTRHCPASEM